MASPVTGHRRKRALDYLLLTSATDLDSRVTTDSPSVNLDDTIVAIATPPGRGGIGVVRLAGPEARKIALPMLRLKHDLSPGHAVFGELVDPNERVGTVAPSSARIDEIV